MLFFLKKSSVSHWSTDAVVSWLHESNLGAFEKVFRGISLI